MKWCPSLMRNKSLNVKYVRTFAKSAATLQTRSLQLRQLSTRRQRLIVKNLPKNCSEAEVRKYFKDFGPLTDVSLKYTPEGVFRKFCFVGFNDDAKANEAVSKFNGTYFGASKVTLEPCAPIEEKNRIKPWSKYSKGSTAYKRIHGDDSVLEESNSKRPRKTENAIPSKYAHDPVFAEFLKVRGVAASAEKSDEVEVDDTKALLDAVETFKGDKNLSLIFRGLPPNLKQTNLKEWLSPIRMHNCFLSRTSNETFAFITFTRPADLKKALARTEQFLGGYKIRICKFPAAEVQKKVTEKSEEMDFEAERKRITDKILDTGRLFLRNLPYICTESDLRFAFQKFGEIVDIQCVVDRNTGNCKGFAVITFMFPESALTAYTELDGTVFKGRMLHILPGEEKPDAPEKEDNNGEGISKFQKERNAKKKDNAQKAFSWNTLFLGANAVADTLAEKLKVSKAEFLEGDKTNSAAVRMALAETRLVNETRQFLVDNGVQLDVFSRPAAKRSNTVILVKNLPAGTDIAELQRMFERFGVLKRFLIPPEAKVTAIVEFDVAVDAKKAFASLAYSRYKTQPLYLEWAPVDVFVKSEDEPREQHNIKQAGTSKDDDEEQNADSGEDEVSNEETDEVKEEVTEEKAENVEEYNGPVVDGRKLFVTNLNFKTTDESFLEFFKKSYKVVEATVSKKSAKNGNLISMGFGFVTFKTEAEAERALRNHQGALLDGHGIELQRHRVVGNADTNETKRATVENLEQGDCTKIIVRNIPFQASEQEVKALFIAFGPLKSVNKGSSHRGFAFVDFIAKEDAQNAFKSLVHSTHLYGRRLVLEWAKEDTSVDEKRSKTAKQLLNAEKSTRMTRRQIRGAVQDGMEAASKEG